MSDYSQLDGIRKRTKLTNNMSSDPTVRGTKGSGTRGANHKKKLKCSQFILSKNEWESLGEFTTYDDISKKLGISYGQTYNIACHLNNTLCKFIKIEDL